MALQARITDVTHTVERDTGDGTMETYDLSLSGRYLVHVNYFDSATPANVLLSHSFEFPVSTTAEQAQAAIVEFGRTVRDARVRVQELSAFEGAVIPL